MSRDLTLWNNAAYKARARALRDAAYADPRAVCWPCGRTLQEGPRYRNGRPSKWHADHVLAGDPRSPLRLAHSLCNERRGRPTHTKEVSSPNG
jgi:hypothetical protein